MDTELLEFRVEKIPFSPEDNLEAKKIEQVLANKTLDSSGFHYGKFYLSGLKKGQGITVANALRRVLLYDIMGLGITKVKFNFTKEGSLDHKKIHEFSTISGIRESILELLMNLRLLIWKNPELDYGSKDLQASHLQCEQQSFQNSSLESFENQNSKVAKNFTPQQDTIVDSKLELPPQQTLSSIKAILPNKAAATSFSGHFSSINCFQNQDVFLEENNKVDRQGSHLQCEQSSGFVLRAKHLIMGSRMKNDIPFFPELMNPEQYLATILPVQKNRTGPKKFPEFEIEYKIENGNMFQERELTTTNDEFLLNSGPFFPVKKVNYTVEEVKNSTSNFVFERGFSECVFFEIWTDGSLHPQKALSEAFTILLDFFQQKK